MNLHEQLHMPTKIPLKFHDPFFTKLREITPLLNESTSETIDAQLHMLTSIPVMFLPHTPLELCITKFSNGRTMMNLNAFPFSWGHN